jgi:hypothetical protein
MPDDILDMRAAQFRGILVTDEDFLTATKEAGQQVERNKALKTMRREVKGHQYAGMDAVGFKHPKVTGKEQKSTLVTNSFPVTRGMGKKIYSHSKDAVVGVKPREAE